ncbi:MAG TPA: hypothetical protein VGL06_16105 [Pseudonocardiaceae bacterium]|jgi:hypothetical protein
MDTATWVLGPVGISAADRVTRVGCRTVLVMVSSVAAGHRLLDLIGLFEGDHRVQVVCTVPATTERRPGAEEFVHAHHGMLLPWSQATQHTFDLVLSADDREIDRVHGKLLLVSDGARRYGHGALLTDGGQVIPRMIALPHESALAVLRRRCPAALPVATVTGDLRLDRLMASVPYRQRYRQALGVADDQTLVTISSTWSPDSTFGRHPGLYRRLLTELPPHRYRVAAVLHPAIWAVHGRWQVRAWLADCIRSGLLLIPPDDGWQATTIAADHVLGDRGSATSYAAALGRPITLATSPDRTIRPGSLAHHIARTATRLDHTRPTEPQLAAARPTAGVTDLLTSRRGVAAGLLRAGMYRLLTLSEPPERPVARPVPAAHAIG